MVARDKQMKEEIIFKDDTIEKLKSTDTAIVLYERKFKEFSEKNQKKDAILKAERDKIEVYDIEKKQLQQTIQETLEANERKDSEISKISAVN